MDQEMERSRNPPPRVYPFQSPSFRSNYHSTLDQINKKFASVQNSPQPSKPNLQITVNGLDHNYLKDFENFGSSLGVGLGAVPVKEATFYAGSEKILNGLKQ